MMKLYSKLSTDMAQEIMCSVGAFVTNSKAKRLKIRIRLNMDESMRWPAKLDKRDC